MATALVIQKDVNAVDPLHPTAAEDSNDPSNPRQLVIGTPVVWTYLVTNPGSVPLTITSITDDAGTPGVLGDNFRPKYVSGDTNNNDLLDPGETWLFTSSGVVSYNAQAGLYGNTITVTGTGTNGQPVTTTAMNWHLGTEPSLFILKAINAANPMMPTPAELAQAAPGRLLPVGTPVVWTYQVYDEAVAPVKVTSIRDDAGTPSNPSDDFTPTPVLQPGTPFNIGDANRNGLLDPGEVWLYTSLAAASGSTTITWDQGFQTVVSNTDTSGAGLTPGFVVDPVQTPNSFSDNIFTGGGSKDVNGISQWQWKVQQPQDKDDIENAFGAAYADPASGHTLLLGELDRYASNGDTTVGFWFFQNPISLNANGTFNGVHTDGDVLLVVDFSVGGVSSNVGVYRWTGTDATGSLTSVPVPPGASYLFVNTGPFLVPWSFIDKYGFTSPQAAEFLRVGLDLNAVFGANVPHFASFLAETRSTNSPTSTLSDFALGSVNSIGTHYTVQPGQYSNTVTVTGVDKGTSVTVSASDKNYSFGVTTGATVVDTADLAVTNTVDRPNPAIGDTVTYTIKAKDLAGRNAATGVRISHLLPAGLTFVSASTTSGIYDPTSGVWNLGTVALGASATLTVQANVTSSDVPGQSLTDTASMLSADQFDPQPANNTASASITLAGGKYLVTVMGPSSVQAGTSFLVAVQAADTAGNPVSTYFGPATATVSISPASAASNFPTTVSINSNGLGLFLANLQQVGTYTITVASGPLTGSAAPETVTAGSPVKLAFAAQPVNTPTGVTLPPATVQVEDLYGNVVSSDNTDTISLGIGSGPGPFTATSTITVPVHNGVATFANLTLINPGTYQISAVVPGHYTGPHSLPFQVAPLQVVPGSFTGTPSGFSLQFNVPYLVNSLTPVLYGSGFGPAAPVPSVIVTTDPANLSDTAAHVTGSLVLNPALGSLAFVATNTSLQTNNGSPVLPDGMYTVIVRSSAANNGFQAVNSGGGFLDGLGTGTPGSGDFTASFTVTAAKQDVVWVPATADGPGQALNGPGKNQVGGGYPIYLNDTTGKVTNVQVTLNYNPALLTVTGVTGVHFSLLSTSSAGHAVLQYNGPALPAGSQVAIGHVVATVPSGTTASPTPYKAKNVLHLSGVGLNGGTVAAATSDAVHLVAYVGDTDGNGAYSNNDAVLITRAGLQTDSGFAAYRLVDPVIVADTDGVGFIPADAALQATEASTNFPTATLSTPSIPGGVVFQAIPNNVDPTLSIPANLQVGADGTVTVPVNIDDAHPAGSTGLIEGHLALLYNPTVFTVSAADVHAGELVMGEDWSIIPTIDQATGQIGIALSSSTPISPSVGGILVMITFHPTSTISGWAPFELVASATPNGQYVATELEDAQGSFLLSPALTNSFDPRIDGVVTFAGEPAVTTSGSTGAEIAPPVLAPRTEIPTISTRNIGAPEDSAAVAAGLQGSGEDGPAALSEVFIHAGSSSSPVAGGGSPASTIPTTLSSGLLGSMPLEVANMSLLAYQLGAGSRLTDPVFPTLMRMGSSPADFSLANPVRQALDHVLAGRFNALARTAAGPDSLDWQELFSELDWQGDDSAALLMGHRAHRDTQICQSGRTAAEPQASADQAAQDLYFAEMAAAMDQSTHDE
jgi:uncharacterized repeat protein (TIGR01451 family)